MDWAKARRGSTRALTSQMAETGIIHTTEVQRNMHRAIYHLHVAELWVLAEYRFDSTVVTAEQQTARDLFVEWERKP